jgi:CxxC motif-containing protein (DUF1111 family)
MRTLAVATLTLVSAACARGGDGAVEKKAESAAEARVVKLDLPDRPLLAGKAELVDHFNAGDALFEATFREPDGLGPLYVRSSCVACHQDDARGPGVVGKMTPVAGRGAEAAMRALPYGDTERPYATAGAKRSLLAPEEGVEVRYRLPPAIFGRGYMEAVDEAEIERLAALAERRDGPVRGRAHRVVPATPEGSEPAAARIGRFGLKARVATLTEFTADALQSDMGLTSPLRPTEPPNPDGVDDDEKPGLDVEQKDVELIADYVRLLEIPDRPAAPTRGRKLFEDVGCGTCHVPTLKTRADYPVSELAGVDAPVYTDFLLHGMGAAFDDGTREGEAGPSEWRTAPLMGLRFLVAYLHDGRAKSVEEAVLMHGAPGSEARTSVEAFEALNATDRNVLLRFVSSL